MTQKMTLVRLFVIAAMFGTSACSNSDPGVETNAATGTAAVQAETTKVAPRAGKPTAPIDISYEIVGNAVVGLPVLINVVVTSPKGPVNVQYSIMDSSALMFQSGQVERLEIVDPTSGSVQQVSVVPQREGRVYVNVSAEIQAEDGLTIRSMAIPIKVGSAPPAEAVNGERVEGPDGEIVISMPASESN